MHLLIKHGAPWRGSYARALRLTPSHLETLATNQQVTNAWPWAHVLGARRSPGKPSEIEIHVATNPLFDWAWPATMRFEAADADAAAKVILQVRRAAEAGMWAEGQEVV